MTTHDYWPEPYHPARGIIRFDVKYVTCNLGIKIENGIFCPNDYGQCAVGGFLLGRKAERDWALQANGLMPGLCKLVLQDTFDGFDVDYANSTEVESIWLRENYEIEKLEYSKSFGKTCRFFAFGFE